MPFRTRIDKYQSHTKMAQDTFGKILVPDGIRPLRAYMAPLKRLKVMNTKPIQRVAFSARVSVANAGNVVGRSLNCRLLSFLSNQRNNKLMPHARIAND